MTTPKNVVRRFAPFSAFQKFLVAETEVGNISRQEVVSMIPPLLMDIKPGMTVLDMCAAPGSKSAQLMEMVHAGEEERLAKVTEAIEKDDTARKQGTLDVRGVIDGDITGFEDDGRSTGLLVANDADYKRAHLLIHQMKRLNSPNLIVTNHDATIYPSIKLPPKKDAQGRNVQTYLKFDRILCDVPCSGDGTARKNIKVWKEWTPGNAAGLHPIQARILLRALQMLKVGGRVVYSTCSMNPLENESVIASVINRCGGPEKVRVVDCFNELPGLKRSPGLRKWNVMDKTGKTWDTYEDVKQAMADGVEGLARFQPSMFPPTENQDHEDLDLSRCMRVYPHQQDTGGFFITVLEKKSEIKAKDWNAPNTNPKRSLAESNAGADEGAEKRQKVNDGSAEPTTAAASEATPETAAAPTETPAEPPKAETEAKEEAPVPSTSNTATPAETPSTAPAPQAAAPTEAPTKKRKPGQPMEEPFKYIDASHPEFSSVFNFYDISPQFPRDRFMVRNAEGRPAKTVYYTSALARDILTANEGAGIKFVHCGVKMFVRQDVQSPETCPWRIQTDGLQILDPWVGQGRVVRLQKKETLRTLLVEMFPRVGGEGWRQLGEIGEWARDAAMGCCVLRVEPGEGEENVGERMVLPLWKSMFSLNLMLPKEERRAMLLRIFNDDTPLVNTTQKLQDNQSSAASTPTSAADAPVVIGDAEAEATEADTTAADEPSA
ncbi:hypothetical protein KEM55_002451 [Ascosphaera atra]|nr:hypothetical protein KEM55_002451 [Ascosphaera atra]